MLSEIFSESNINRLNEEHAAKSAEDRLRFAIENISPLGMTTSFQISGSVLVDMLAKIKPDLNIFFIDTGYLFPETHECRAALESKYGMKFEALMPRITVAEQDAKYGKDMFGFDSDKCCEIRKVEPLQRKLDTLDGWITGLRREQSDTRKQTGIFELNKRPNGKPIIKVNPVADWSKKQVWDYVLDRGIPYISLYDKGYPSIGCWPCTEPVGEDADERAGRWAGKGKTECGIHTFMERKA